MELGDVGDVGDMTAVISRRIRNLVTNVGPRRRGDA